MHKTDDQRRLFLRKDLNELDLWMQTLEFFNFELDHFSIIEKQLVCNSRASNLIQALRRKNVLNMAALCKYEQELKVEFEYGKTDYDIVRARIHEAKRNQYSKLTKEQHAFKMIFFKELKKFQRK